MKGNEKVEDTKVKNRRTDNTMVPRRKTKGKVMIYKTATQKIWVDIGAPEHEQN